MVDVGMVSERQHSHTHGMSYDNGVVVEWCDAFDDGPRYLIFLKYSLTLSHA
jgi:hypothetical protein